jgi:hypothetical protein
MPYRRLPNTDQSRIRAITTAIERSGHGNESGLVIDPKTLNDAKAFLPTFESAHHDYLLSLEKQKVASKKYYNQQRMARLYISHFIQVLNFCVIRNEIKRENKKLYGLDPDVHTVPDLNSETAILSWGEQIIKGEKERIAAGGPPIYNPTIAKVTVYFEVFRDTCVDQKMHQKNTNRFLDTLSTMRPEGDAIILDIWNQAERYFEQEPEERRRELCEQYGVRYYLRKNEKSND